MACIEARVALPLRREEGVEGLAVTFFFHRQGPVSFCFACISQADGSGGPRASASKTRGGCDSLRLSWTGEVPF